MRRGASLWTCLAVLIGSAPAFGADGRQNLQSCEDVFRAYPEVVRGLLGALDLRRDELAEVRAAVKAEDPAAACEAILRHYAGPGVSGRWRQEDGKYEKELADKAVADELPASGIWARTPRAADGGMDWSSKGPPGYTNNQWGQINRFEWARHLLWAGFDLSEPKYHEKLDEYLRDWCVHAEQHQQYMTRAAGDGWPRVWDRKLNAGIRMRGVWQTVFFSFFRSERFRDATKVLMLAHVARHGEYIRKHHAESGNHLSMELTGLFELAAAFPEFRQSPEWMAYADKVLGEQFRAQFYPDGVHKEMAYNYHWIVVQDLEQWLAGQRRMGRRPDPAFERIAEAGWHYMAMSVKPDGKCPNFNDVNHQSFATRVLAKAEQAERGDWQYVLTNGAKGTEPKGPPSVMFPWAGKLYSRSGWGANSHWSGLDVGPWGLGHQHNDKLHVSIHAHGRDLLVDAGRYTYKDYMSIDPNNLRGYVRASWGHNVILVDGQSQTNDPELVAGRPVTDWRIAETHDYAVGRWDHGWLGGRTGRHTRALVYVRGRYWVAMDRIALDAPGSVQVLWHFHPDCTTKADGQATATVDRGVGNLRIQPVHGLGGDWKLGIVKGAEKPYQGWFSPVQNQIVPSPCAIYERRIDGPVTFAWVLVPGQGNVSPVRATVLESGDDGLRLRIADADGRRPVEVAAGCGGLPPHRAALRIDRPFHVAGLGVEAEEDAVAAREVEVAVADVRRGARALEPPAPQAADQFRRLRCSPYRVQMACDFFRLMGLGRRPQAEAQSVPEPAERPRDRTGRQVSAARRACVDRQLPPRCHEALHPGGG